jgi:16S rRNA A1518/A1519 N6-dimethyltransferase RsmA/KsgA/DIM1 with predicted DNA glycosylase/AP lyase activity
MIQKPDRKIGVGAGIGGLTTVIVGLVAAFTSIEIDAVTAVGFTSFMTFVAQYFVPNP